MSGRYSSEDDDDDKLPHKRRKDDPVLDIEERLESLITRVGEKSTSSLESNLEGLATVLQADLSSYKDRIIRILCECVIQMSEKLTVYSTLVGLLNAHNYNAGGEFVESLVRQLKEALKTAQFDNGRVIVRFLSDLVNCNVISPQSLMLLFDNFLEVALEDSIPQVRSDWYVYAVLSAIPWAGRELFEKKEKEFEKLLKSIGDYIDRRQKIHLSALQVWSSDRPHPQEDYLDCLWAQIRNLQQSKWLEKQIVRPYLAFDSQLCEALHHNLPQILPPPHSDDVMYPLPFTVFRMFDYTDVPEGFLLPGSHAIERYLIEEQLHLIVHSYYHERKDIASNLLSYTTKSKIPLNYMIVEVVFAQLFHLPRAPHLEILYGSLLIELCRLQPSSMPQVLAQASDMLFERLDTMKATCIERFSLWFSYHLSNYQFRWSWDEWGSCAEQDFERPQPKFIHETLQKCMRLSYHQRIVETLPDVFAPLVPPQPITCFKYGGESLLPGASTSAAISEMIRRRASSEEILLCLQELPNPLQEEETIAEPTHNPLKIQVFVHTLFNLASKSISHCFAAIAKFHAVLKEIADKKEGQICLLGALYELWHLNQQMLVVVVDKLLKTQILQCSSVANWLFSMEMAPDFTNFFVWEIMHATIKKMNKQVAKLQFDMEEARDQMEAYNRKKRGGFEVGMPMSAPSEEHLEEMEDLLQCAQKEQKNLFLIIFQRFIIILTEHLAKCETDGSDFSTHWYKWVIERLQEVFLRHHEQVFNYNSTLESLLFTSENDMHILAVFQQFCALRC